MSVIHHLDRMINELEKSRTQAEYIIMGKKIFLRVDDRNKQNRKYHFKPQQKKI